MQTQTSPHQQSQQTGMVLVVVTLMLLAISLILLGRHSMVGEQETVAQNRRDRLLGFEAAEAALRTAEKRIQSNAGGVFEPLQIPAFGDICVAGLCRSSLGAEQWPKLSDEDWTQPKKVSSYAFSKGSSSPMEPALQASYVIEYQGTLKPLEPTKPCVALFLITARGAGPGVSSPVYLQSLYRHRATLCRDTLLDSPSTPAPSPSSASVAQTLEDSSPVELGRYNWRELARP